MGHNVGKTEQGAELRALYPQWRWLLRDRLLSRHEEPPGPVLRRRPVSLLPRQGPLLALGSHAWVPLGLGSG